MAGVYDDGRNDIRRATAPATQKSERGKLDRKEGALHRPRILFFLGL